MEPALPTALAYESPGARANVATRGQGLAKASWAAPSVGMLVGLMTLELRNNIPLAAVSIGILITLLVAFGWIVGVVALTGISRWGRRRVLAPAVIGILLNSFLLMAIGNTWWASYKRASQRQTQQAQLQFQARLRAQQKAAAEQQGRDAFLTGHSWLGFVKHGNLDLTITTVSDEAELARSYTGQLGTDATIAVVGMRNRDKINSYVIDTTGSVVHFTNGSTASALDARQVLAGPATAELRALMTPPFTVHPREEITFVLFLHPGTNPRMIQQITLTVDGQPASVSGRYLTAAEKQKLRTQTEQRSMP